MTCLRLVAGLAVALAACSEPPDEPSRCPFTTEDRAGTCVPLVPDCAATALPVVGGGCLDLGPASCAAGFVPAFPGGCAPDLPAAPCPEGTRATLGRATCAPVGVELCGFVGTPDGQGGCAVELPAEPCPPGSRESPGEAVCVPLGDCGEGTWGLLQHELGTLYVDGSHAGGDADGSRYRPFPTLQAALDLLRTTEAFSGRILVAEGVYDGPHEVSGDLDLGLLQTLIIEGRCAARVTLRGAVVAGEAGPALELRRGAFVTLMLQGVSLTGPGPGLVLHGGEATLGGLDVRDTGAEGIRIDEGRVSIWGSVIAGATGVGLRSRARRLDLVDSVIRDTRPLPDGSDGRGLVVEGDDQDARTTVSSAVLLRHGRAAIDVSTGLLDVSATLVAATARDASTLEGGHGITVTAGGTVASGLTLEGALIVDSAGAGVRLVGGWATLTDTLIRGPGGTSGPGLVTGTRGELAANVNLTRCTIEGAGTTGLDLAAGEVRVDGLLVRDTGPAPLAPGEDPVGRAGVVVRCEPGAACSGAVRLVDSVIARTRGAGVAVTGRSVSITTSVVQGAAAAPDGTGGAGVTAWCLDGTGTCATVSVERSLIEDSAGSGIAGSGGRLVVEGSVIRRSGSDALAVDCAPLPAGCGDLRVGESVLTDAPGAGIRLAGPGAQVEGCTIQGTGTAVEATCDATSDRCGPVRLAHLHADGYQDAGLRLSGVDARLELALLLGDREDGGGRALHGLLAGCTAAGCGRLEVHLSRLSGHAGTGLISVGQPVRLVGVMVDDVDAEGTSEADPDHGEGIVIACDPGSGACGVATLSGVLVTDVAGVGILLLGTPADVSTTRVLGVAPRRSDGRLGYGLQASGPDDDPRVRVDLRYCHVSAAAAIGVVYAGAVGDVVSSQVDGTVLPLAWTDPDAVPAVNAYCTLVGTATTSAELVPGLDLAGPP